MFPELGDLLFYPDRFFSRQDTLDINMLVPAVIMGLSGLIAVGFFTGSRQGLDPVMILATLSSAGWMILFELVIWGIYSVLLYYLGLKLGGSGELFRVAEYTGLGMLPGLVISILSIGVSWLLVISADVLAKSAAPDPLTLSWFIAVSGVLMSLISLVWSGYIWIFGLCHAHAIQKREAVYAVLIVVGLSVMMIIWPVILNAMMEPMYPVH